MLRFICNNRRGFRLDLQFAKHKQLQHQDLYITYTCIFTSQQVYSLISLLFPFIQTLLPSASSGYTIIGCLSSILQTVNEAQTHLRCDDLNYINTIYNCRNIQVGTAVRKGTIEMTNSAASSNNYQAQAVIHIPLFERRRMIFLDG